VRVERVRRAGLDRREAMQAPARLQVDAGEAVDPAYRPGVVLAVAARLARDDARSLTAWPRAPDQGVATTDAVTL
jgi:hypothetical protein